MRAFDHYARRPEAVATAERALRAWRLEALRLRRRTIAGHGAGQALAAAEQEIAAARDFLAPPSIDVSPSTLRLALNKLQTMQLTQPAFDRPLTATLAGDDAVAKAARLLTWQAPGAGAEPASDRARRLRLSAGSSDGKATLRHAIAYGTDLLGGGVRAIP